MNYIDFLVYLGQVFPEARDLRITCPALSECGLRGNVQIKRNLFMTIVHLNDYHRWSRDRIADWVDLTAARHGLDLAIPTPTELPPHTG